MEIHAIRITNKILVFFFRTIRRRHLLRHSHKLDNSDLIYVIFFLPCLNMRPAFRLHLAFFEYSTYLDFWKTNGPHFRTCYESSKLHSFYLHLLSECFSLPFVNLAQLCSSVVNFFQPINQDFINNIVYQKTDGMKSIGFVFGALFFCWSWIIWLQTF